MPSRRLPRSSHLAGLLVVAAAIAGCTAPNPDYLEPGTSDGGGLTGRDLAGEAPDLAAPEDLTTVVDLTVATQARDLAVAPGCGNVGQRCCDSMRGPYCTAPMTRCDGIWNGTCRACGGAGQACCPGNLCQSGCCVKQSVTAEATCVAPGGACPQNGGTCGSSGGCSGCGAIGQRCCGNITALYCTQPGSACAPGAQSTCVACGGNNQRCCDGSYCNTGLRCNYSLAGAICQP